MVQLFLKVSKKKCKFQKKKKIKEWVRKNQKLGGDEVPSRFRRAQIFGGEFLLAYTVFLIALSLAFILWSNSQVSVLSSEGIYEMEDISNNVVEQLIRTKGIPENWTYENVKSVGLSNRARILDLNKTINFIYLMN